MNFLPLILGFLLFKMLPSFKGNSQKDSTSNNQKSKSPFSDFNIEDISQALQLVSLFNKLKDKKVDMGEAMSEMMSNPLAQEIFKRFSGGEAKENQEERYEDTSTQSASQQEEKEIKFTNDDRENFQAEKTEKNDNENDFSENNTEELFKPIENIAGVEVTEALKKYYDNWYLK